MIPGISCSTCAFFAPPPFSHRGQRIFGQCRRHAPILDLGEDRPRTIWPLVQETAWCGEHAEVEGGE